MGEWETMRKGERVITCPTQTGGKKIKATIYNQDIKQQNLNLHINNKPLSNETHLINTGDSFRI